MTRSIVLITGALLGPVLTPPVEGSDEPVLARWARASSEHQDTTFLAEHLEAFRPLLGEWEGNAEAQGMHMRSQWEWAATAGGSALLLTVAEGFGGETPTHTMTELLTRAPAGDHLDISTANGRGRFTLQGTMRWEGDAWVREWDMMTAAGRTIRGRDRMTLESPDRIRWTQYLNNGDGWVEVSYSPFELTRVGGRHGRRDRADSWTPPNELRFPSGAPG